MGKRNPRKRKKNQSLHQIWSKIQMTFPHVTIVLIQFELEFVWDFLLLVLFVTFMERSYTRK